MLAKPIVLLGLVAPALSSGVLADDKAEQSVGIIPRPRVLRQACGVSRRGHVVSFVGGRREPIINPQIRDTLEASTAVRHSRACALSANI
jgi:hypothetical protein